MVFYGFDCFWAGLYWNYVLFHRIPSGRGGRPIAATEVVLEFRTISVWGGILGHETDSRRFASFENASVLEFPVVLERHNMIIGKLD